MKNYMIYTTIVLIVLSVIVTNPLYAGFRGGQVQLDVSDEDAQAIEAAMPEKATVEPEKPRKILVFCSASGFQHSSIPHFNRALKIMGEKTDAFKVDISTELNDFLPDNLKQYDAICFNNTTSMPLSPETTPQICKSIMDFIENGKGIIGIHAAVDNFGDWPEAQEMFGNVFVGHPWTENGVWSVKFDEPNHPLMAPFEGHKDFKIQTEIFRTWPPLFSRDKQLVLMSLNINDEATKSAARDERDMDTGISWIKKVGEGRLFYCNLGHGGNITTMTPIMEHYLLGIQWTLGDLEDVDATPKGTKTEAAE